MTDRSIAVSNSQILDNEIVFIFENVMTLNMETRYCNVLSVEFDSHREQIVISIDFFSSVDVTYIKQTFSIAVSAKMAKFKWHPSDGVICSPYYIESRPSIEQVMAIVDFMEKHPSLALGQLRGLEGRDESKRLWLQLTRIVNNINGPTRPMKSWVKYWADKKSTVRSKVVGSGGDSNNLGSNIEKKIWDLFLANNDSGKVRGSVKQESHYLEDSLFNEDSMDHNHIEVEPVMAFEDTPDHTDTMDVEDRQTAIMEKLVKVMSEQASALSQLAHASHLNAQAMERLAEASHIQARAIERLANTFDSINAATHDVRNAIVDIDTTMKRFYNTSPT